MKRIAVVAGASGLVGRGLLEGLRLEGRYDRVIALVRQPLRLTGVEERPADFARLDSVLGDLYAAGAVDVFCCLGTTLARAGSAAAFRKVDFDYVVALAAWAKRIDARRLLVISSLGADSRSRALYARTKGEMELALRAIGLNSLVILRPSLLVGKRTETRPAETLALALSNPLRRWIPARWRPVAASDVAAVMLAAATLENPPGLIESAAMQGAGANGNGAPGQRS